MHLINFSTLNKQHYIISPAVNPCHEQASETSYINLSNLTDYILYHCDKTESMGENQDKQEYLHIAGASLNIAEKQFPHQSFKQIFF